MKKGFRIIAVVLLLLVLHMVIKAVYPDVTFPMISLTNSDPDGPSENGSNCKIYYDLLSPVEKRAYNCVLDNIYELPDKIQVPRLTKEELENVWSAILSDNPDLFFIGRKSRTAAELWCIFFSSDYIVKKEEYNRMKEELDAVCDSIIASLSDPTDVWQSELEIHDYIIDHCKYKLVDGNLIYSSAYGCLVNGEAGCEGYSKAMKLLLDRIGVENCVVSGTGRDSGGTSVSHMWNIINIDGNYYHVDCTWDDPVRKDGRNLKLHTYFNVSDKVISRDHKDIQMPDGISCDSMNANYDTQKKSFFTAYNSVQKENIRKLIISEYNSGSRRIQLRFSDRSVYEAARKDLIDRDGLMRMLSDIRSDSGTSLASKKVTYSANDDAFTLVFNIE